MKEKMQRFYILNKYVRVRGRQLLLLIALSLPFTVWADEIPIRYVKTSENGGNFVNDGTSWDNAKNNVQEAINSLYAYMTLNKLTKGYVYVAAGTYYPTTSTETGSENKQHLSFIIYPGVHVFGGFKADEDRDIPDPNEMNDEGTDFKYRPHHQLSNLLDEESHTTQAAIQQPWNFENQTILSGNLAETEPVFTYDGDRGTYKTIFYSNSYHVVWFATNGFIEPSQDINYGWDETSLTGHARRLPNPASIDGCTITGGYAATKANSGHTHTAFGAGAYMVEGSSLVNCVVEKCLAMTNGGGVYMDGGGLVDKCYINTCQATGQTMLQGFGGGVCINYNGEVTRSYIVNNSARSGGGVAIYHAKDEYPWHSRAKEEGLAAIDINNSEINVYSPHATACIISNNSSTNEAAGIYFYNGGVGNHLTITRNKCFGSDVSYYGRRQGRSGGIYVLNGGQIYNSVIWGNLCDANNDIQYACHTSGSTDVLKPQVSYSGFDKHESTDWSGTSKINVYSLSKDNINTSGNNAIYPYFIGIDGQGKIGTYTQRGSDDPEYSDVYGAGLGLTKEEKDGENTITVFSGAIPRPITWKPAAISGLAEKGVQVTDALEGADEWIKHAHTETDMLGFEYEPVSSLGALVRREELMAACVDVVPNQEIVLYKDRGFTQDKADSYSSALSASDLTNFLPDDGTNTTLPTVFVDPSRKIDSSQDIGIGTKGIGSSWSKPAAHINDAIHYFRGRQWKKGTANEYQYNIGGRSDGAGGFTGGTNYPYVQILVKGAKGTLVTSTAGLDAYLGEELRTASIRPCSNMRIYGGYEPSLTGTESERGNLREHRTRVTANVINSSYHNNSAHVFALSNVKNVIIDGFEIFYGNANLNADQSYAPIDPETGKREAITYGGGLILNNANAVKADRIDMTGNILRNSVIAHCSAPDGAAIYVNGGNKKEGDVYSKAELNVINTIIRNNTVGDGVSGLDTAGGQGAGVVVARGKNAIIRLDHCDLVNNCGYPLETLSTDGTTANEGNIRIYNSVIYANNDKDIANRKNIRQPLSYRSETGSTTQVDGDYIFIDWDAQLPGNLAHCFAVFCRDMSDEYQKWAMRKVDAYQNTVVENGDPLVLLFSDQVSAQDKYDELGGAGSGWTVPVQLDYPFFTNPAKNVGHSEEGDKPINGGSIDYMPQATNPMVNAAIDQSRNLWDGDDISRDYGGDPDIGAVECTELLENGAVIYVTEHGAGKRDGSSWANAIAGDLVYRVGGSYVIDETNFDKTLADTNEKVVTTKNDLYCGGYALDYVYQTGKTTYVDRQTVTQKRINLTYETDGSVTIEEGESTLPEERETTQAITKNNELTRQPSNFIYGEISGSSRNFYRTNLKDAAITGAYQDDTGNNGYRGFNLDNDLFINNNRDEVYVSGLQFAVEKAAVLNKDKDAKDRVQVWVGNGRYEDYKGFVMRDKVSVYGGFPASTYSTPSMNERHALVSSRIPLSASNQTLEGKQDDYETILQVQNKRPYDNNYVFNSEVANFWDKDYQETGNRTITTTDAVTIPKYYRRDANGDDTYSDWYEVRGNNVIQDCTSNIINPSFEQNSGRGAWDGTKAKYGWTISTGSISLKAGKNSYSATHGAIVQNVADGYEVYQDIYNLESGFYRVSCQGFNQQNAVNKIALFANGEQRVLMSVEGSTITDLSNCVGELAQGKYDDNWVDVYVSPSGHLRIGIKGTYSGNGITTFDNFRLERLSDATVTASTIEDVKEEGYSERTVKKEYTTLRKPVLFMPDVCLPTYWPGKINNSDNPSNENRAPKRKDGILTPTAGSGYVAYTDVVWDGLTIRNGFLYDYYANRDGGAGVRMFEGGTLQNCVIVDNGNIGARRVRGGGGYCDGKTSYIISCFFIDNLNSGRRKLANGSINSTTDFDTNGGGIYLLVGTCYNSLLANNVCWGNDSRGAGIYIESATFYNNTVAYNNCYKRDGSINVDKGNGVHQYTGNMGATLNVFNTIFYKNGVNASDASKGGPAIGAQSEGSLNIFKNCFIQSEKTMGTGITGKMQVSHLYNGYNIDCPNPFALGDDAPTSNNYRLASSSLCINSGNIPDDVAATFPDNDVDFADRVQDCQVDIGAYEYDGTIDIHPSYELIDFGGKRAEEDYELCAVYYVTANGNSAGNSSASSPTNAACATKLQKVLDAAGRLKYDLSKGSKIFSTAAVPWEETVTAKKEVYDNNAVSQISVTGQNLSGVTHVIVKLADAEYMPDRSTDERMATGQTEDEILTHSLIIPHGVEVWGGYQFKNDPADPTDFWEYTRDILKYKSIMSGNVENKRTGTIGEAYHVVSFTNHIFDLNDGIYFDDKGDSDESNDLDGENKLRDLTDPAILDGIYIQNGDANGIENADKNGAAGVVTGYAHIRNCVIKDNVAAKQGGGLYLQPGAMVSGCIFLDNEAEEGGAIYVVEPETNVNERPDADYARVYNSTIVKNTASMKAGGIFFDTNIRAKGVVLWQNTANDMNNVAGTFDSEKIQEESNYPFSYCAVQNRRLPGVNNQEVAGESGNGVRWTSTSADNPVYWNGEPTNSVDAFYYIERVSSLVRTGMPYVMYENLRNEYKSLELKDIAGVFRMEYGDANVVKGADYKKYFGLEGTELVKKDNGFLEIGARALNAQMSIDVETATPMTRLFVAKPEDVDNKKADALLTSNDPLYSQQGSSMPNPFTKFSDALDYIVKLRNFNHSYANTRFEIFVAGGTYWPYQNVFGKEGNARSSTFVLPEGVTIVGGIDPEEPYCQAGYDFTLDVVDDSGNNRTGTYGTVTFESKTTEQIREEREPFDINDNTVYEPWEFKNETVFSGNTPRGNENEDNVFHVFTAFADPDYVGTLPTITKVSNTETEESLQKRMIILDGVTVKEGNARDYESIPEGSGLDKTDPMNLTVTNKKMFYRGGGIMVDGNWTEAESDSYQPSDRPYAKASRDIPLVISRCLFQNNNAIQGGAIFTNGTLDVFSSSFVQNYARGPVSNKKQSSEDDMTALGTIQYVGGGAIATNGNLLCVNTIFANNEAMLGESREKIDGALGYYDQGFGGVIWGGEEAEVSLLNCNLVKNQAVSYPGVYLKARTLPHFFINSVFWGNNATGVPSGLTGFSHIQDISNDVVNFRRFDKNLLYYCAYEDGRGPVDNKADEKINGRDPHAIPYYGDRSNIASSMGSNSKGAYNNNVIITPENEGVDGPNFLLPSSTAGKEGYNASANWMASRVNKLTDNGWSYLTVAPDNAGEMKFAIETDSELAAYMTTPTSDVTTSGGVFNWCSNDVWKRFELNLMPLGSVGDDGKNYYMKFSGSGMTDQMSSTGQSYMQRISSNPLSREAYDAYIDIGVYEYQHRTLKINQGSEIDVIWVTETENPEAGNDGYSWETATSNIQVAIETLLKSRNDHGKRLNIIAGSYKPMTIVGNNLGYTLETNSFNNGAYTPYVTGQGDDIGPDQWYGVKYINLRGGYDKEVPDENGYDYQKNQVVFSMEQRTGVKEDQLNHIVNISDIEQFKTKVPVDRKGDGTPKLDEDGNVTLLPLEHNPTGEAIPVIIEGITFENTLAQGIDNTLDDEGDPKNPGGAAVYYKEQKKSTDSDSYLDAPSNGMPKLTIRNCTFSENGKDVANPSSAVKIAKGGGQALIVNSVFHSNTGNPVDAINTVVLNCTSAMNGGHMYLTGDDTDKSQIHNSVIWQDDQNAAIGSKKQFEVEGVTQTEVEVEVKGQTVTVIDIDSDQMTYNAITGVKENTTRQNEPLSDTNNDLEEGPNFLFMNPNDEDPDKRDFRIRPSLKLLERGDNGTYAEFVWPNYKFEMNEKGEYELYNGERILLSDDDWQNNYKLLMTNKHQLQTVEQTFTTKIREGNDVKTIEYRGLHTDKDLDRAFYTRLIYQNIDRGAYECTSQGQRVIYVDPEKFGTGLEKGNSWENAMGRGNLQRAIDAAAVYVRNKQSEVGADPELAYVFVRGDNMYNEGEINIRDGVHVYGTAPISIEATPENPGADLYTYTDEELNNYVSQVKAIRSGIVYKSLKTESFTPTYVSTLASMGTYTLGSVFDGLMLYNGKNNLSDKSIVNIASDAKVAIRNCLVIHNSVDASLPVVNMAGGLLYNTLIYDSHGGDVVNVGSNGYVLNCTVIADDTEQNAVTGTMDHVKNTIAIDNGDPQNMFAPYMKEGGNKYTPGDFLTSHRPYWYQLHENSSEIDNGNAQSAAGEGIVDVETWLTDAWKDYVDFANDRDLLGNPRRINDKVDNGCFETWKVKSDNPLTATAESNFYPHGGSVVYIMDNARLMLAENNFNDINPLVPGYLLVKEGGSLYGQGNHITSNYVAVEKTIPADGQYSLMSVPYRCNPASTVAISYDDGSVSQALPSGMTGSTYDGEKRSKWDYQYKADNSDCWVPQTGFIPANQGWLLSFNAALESATTYRFTGWGEAQLDYIYTEDGSDKTVTLTQYNHIGAEDETYAHFTNEENMGWNLTGLPWLVSGYATNTLSGGTYAMNVPHVLYGDLTSTGAPGQFYSAQSWANGSTLSPGEGVFMQTAVLDETETLTFKLPVYVAPSHSRAHQQIGVCRQSGTRGDSDVRYEDVVDVYPQEGADAAMSYRLGADGIKWMAFNESVAQIYVENAVGTRLSLVSAAPVETEISLGVKAPEAGDYVISLPEPEAYSDYEAVWVIDNLTGASANLLTENFILSVRQAGDITDRLKLKFGGMRPDASDTMKPGVIKVAARYGRLPMPTIADHEMIRIYNPTGALIFTGPASDSHNLWLPDGVYIIQRDL